MIDEAQLALLPAPDNSETQMLDFVATERMPGSRLACQIKLQAQHQGLRLTLPERQF
jgi:2Fe-2S ferredoxin